MHTPPKPENGLTKLEILTMSRKYFNNTDIEKYTLQDLVGRSVEVRQFRDIQSPDDMILTVAMDIQTGEFFVINVEYMKQPEVVSA